MFVSVYTTASMWRPEDSCGVGSLDRVDSGDWTQALRLGGKHFYPLSHLTPSYARVAILSQSYPPSPPLSLSLSLGLWFVVGFVSVFQTRPHIRAQADLGSEHAWQQACATSLTLPFPALEPRPLCLGKCSLLLLWLGTKTLAFPTTGSWT